MKVFRITTLFVCLLVAVTAPVIAICNPPSTAGDDTIDCTGTTTPDAEGQAGNDTITVQSGATVTNNVAGDSAGAVPGTGDDTIINDGDVANRIFGDSTNGAGSGNDTIINNGTTGDIFGDNNGGGAGTGDDVIVNNGTVTNFGIHGDSSPNPGTGDDTITNNGTVNNDIFADSVAGDGSGNDTVTNNGAVNDVWGDSPTGVGSGSDTITNNGTADELSGDTQTTTAVGSDTITNNGSANVIYGDSVSGTGSGSDTITNNGGVGTIYGDSGTGAGTGNDTITNSGNVSGDIIAAGGNDTVIIQGNNATVGGTMDGGAGTDTLTFDISTADPDELNEWAAQIAAANPAGGSLTFNGHTYTWTNFEQLTNLLTLIRQPRLNELYAPVAVFCAPGGGVDVYLITPQSTGDFSLRVAISQVAAGLADAAASGQNVLIGSAPESSVYALTSGQVQVNTPDGYAFAFVYESSCGALTEIGDGISNTIVEDEDFLSIINRPR